MIEKIKDNFIKEKGVTLIALVVTIVVLIILATATINTVFRKDGILEKTKQEQAEQEMKNVKEKVMLMLPDYMLKEENKGKTLFEYLTEKKNNTELDNVIDNRDGTITAVLDGHEVIVRESDLTVMNVTKAEENKKDYIIQILNKANYLTN